MARVNTPVSVRQLSLRLQWDVTIQSYRLELDPLKQIPYDNDNFSIPEEPIMITLQASIAVHITITKISFIRFSLVSRLSTICVPTKNKGGGEFGIDSHMISLHNDIAAIP